MAAQLSTATATTARGARLRQYSAAPATAETTAAPIGTSWTGRTISSSPGPSRTNVVTRNAANARAASARRGHRVKGPRNLAEPAARGAQRAGAVPFTVTPRV
ncbi:hypothetical protein Acsp03_68830 [Actinomadura sp. NBRC 104412]|uniref:hypothetical protein n=1 Tax=Actinomadura sp. NBRC 104412 TaxID=3032203 RepID=UPI0024A526BD|nr:hypothetical protein [Actinomadura sp. NBRC 104412]GLZ09417.1 hypothetical protein Acsp03_68830 [Actinomadura sp. NBRC 104412]